jgi:shikimate dehydrogenase
MIDGRTKLVGVMGWPVAHSLSPPMHNAAFDALHLSWRYVPCPVPPAQVGAALAGLFALGFAGVNVTVPHKQAVIPHLAALSDAARAIGAVNTIVVGADGTLYGDNTDADGFLASLREAGCDPRGARVALLGAGGAARAVAYALATAGASQIGLWNRTPARAQAIVDDLRPLFPGTTLTASPSFDDLDVRDADLIVNCTSVGMWPHDDASPWPSERPLPADCLVVDLIYRPQETLFLRQARAAGARTLNGVGMLVHQGAAAFRLWTGVAPPVEVMREALLTALAR